MQISLSMKYLMILETFLPLINVHEVLGIASFSCATFSTDIQGTEHPVDVIFETYSDNALPSI